jgi:hypothetical protein
MVQVPDHYTLAGFVSEWFGNLVWYRLQSYWNWIQERDDNLHKGFATAD